MPRKLHALIRRERRIHVAPQCFRLALEILEFRARVEAALRRLELTIVRRLEGFLHGDHLGLLPGPGSDTNDARVYQPGQDDVRKMDWAVTARTRTPHVRDTIADRELEIWALLDATPPGDTPQAWLIADSRALRRYGLGHARPFPFTPEAWRRTGYLYVGETPEALAKSYAELERLRQCIMCF